MKGCENSKGLPKETRDRDRNRDWDWDWTENEKHLQNCWRFFLLLLTACHQSSRYESFVTSVILTNLARETCYVNVFCHEKSYTVMGSINPKNVLRFFLSVHGNAQKWRKWRKWRKFRLWRDFRKLVSRQSEIEKCLPWITRGI